MDHVAIIRELGGPHALADALRAKGLNVADVTARSWTLTGRSIPAKYWSHIAQVATEKGKQVSFEDMARAVAA